MPDNPCHTCRRRRLKCDRSLPSCQRCLKADRECLGYGKLFRWNRGVASRGKMMGKTFALPPSNTTIDRQGSEKQLQPNPEITGMPLVPRAPPLQPFRLVDPLVQEFSLSVRFYLVHFDLNFCKDLVVYDTSPQNAVRQLLPYIRQHPLLLHMIVATSAHHLHNLSHPELNHRDPIYHDALRFKHSATQLLQRAVENIGQVDMVIVVVAALLFIYMEFTIGDRTWRTHLEGAKALISHVKRHTGGNFEGFSSTPFICRWLVSEILMMDVMGSTLSSAWLFEPSIYTIDKNFDLDLIVQLVEVNNFTSYPAPLLKHLIVLMQMYSTSTRCTDPEEQEQEQIVSMLRSIQQFNPVEWASTIQALSARKDFDHRVHIASAYKDAITLYASRALPPDHPQNYPACERQKLVQDIIDQISQFNPENGLFKCTIWPCFIAGAEARDPGQRAWVMSWMRLILHALPYRTLSTAMETLEAIWRSDPVGGGDAGRQDWFQTIRQLGVDLFVA